MSSSSLVLAMVMASNVQAQVAEVYHSIGNNTDDWAVDRSETASFDNVSWQGRDDVLKIGVEPPDDPAGFYNWQGYQQRTETPAGDSFLRGDLWIGSSWESGSETDFVRTGMWGSALPDGRVESDTYVDSETVFPIISFTNENGVGRFEVWDSNANPVTGWVDIADTADLIDYDGWNSVDIRLLPDSDRVEYLINGSTIYTWDAPRADDGNISDQFWSVYLNGRNNDVTSFDTYWSDVNSGTLVDDGEEIDEAPGEVHLTGADGLAFVGQDVTIEGGVVADAGSGAGLSFKSGAGILISDAGAHGVRSTEGGVAHIIGGAVTTSGTGAHGFYADGEGSGIESQGTSITVSGINAYGVSATGDASISMTGGSVTSASRALSADGGGITTTAVDLASTVADDNTSEFGVAQALDGGTISLTDGSINATGGRISGLLSLAGGNISADGVTITADGDRARGAYAGASEGGAGSIEISNGSIKTNGLLSHGLFAKRESGTVADTVATITAYDIHISVDGQDANGIYADAGGEITVTGGTVMTSGAGGHALHAQKEDDGLTGAGVLTETGLVIETEGEDAFGGYAEKGGTLRMTDGSVSTLGAGAHGVVSTGNGSTATLTGVNLSAEGTGTDGVRAELGGNVTVTGGTISSVGDDLGRGVNASGAGSSITLVDTEISVARTRVDGVDKPTGVGVQGLKGGIVTMDGGSVTTLGDWNDGFLAYRGTIDASGASITTDGTAATGVKAYSEKDELSRASLDDMVVTTKGNESYGLSAHNGNSHIEAKGSEIRTRGSQSYGASAYNGGAVDLSGTSVATQGASAHGLVINSMSPTMAPAHAAGQASSITMEGGSVTTVADDASGVFMRDGATVSLTGVDFDTGGGTVRSDFVGSGQEQLLYLDGGTQVLNNNGTFLKVTRTEDGADGVIKAILTGGSRAVGDVIDIDGKSEGYSTVTVDDAELRGALSGVQAFSLQHGGTWSATGDADVESLAIGEGGGTINVVADTAGISGALTGSGSLTKSGAGTLHVSGKNDGFTGPTTITEGRLLLTGSLASDITIRPGGTMQVGDGGTDGDLTGATRNDGTLIFARSDDYDYVGALSGTGSLVKRGDGLLLLSGAYSYTGSTVVEGGRVRLAADLDPQTGLVVDDGDFDLSDREQEVSSLSGGGGSVSLGDHGELTVNQNTDTSFGGSLGGGGSFTKSGTGSLNLTGTSTFTGTTNIDAGRLAVNGVLPGSVNVNSGGVLGGNGTTGSFVVHAGGTADPGNSIGHLTSTGPVIFKEGSTYTVELDAAGNSDRISTQSTATIEGGKVSVLAENGDYAPATTYLILHADGGVSGMFNDVESNLAFLEPVLDHDAHNVYLSMLRNDLSFADAAATPNQRAAAGQVDATFAYGTDIYDSLIGASAEQAQAAFDSLSGEIHATAISSVAEDATLLRRAVMERSPRRVREGVMGLSMWAQGLGSWSDIDGDGNAAAVDHSTYGVLTGAELGDGRRARLGVMFGYSESKTNVAQRRSQADIDGVHVGAYGSLDLGLIGVRGGFTYSDLKFDVRRTAEFRGFSEHLTARYDGSAVQTFAEAGHIFEARQSVLEPFAGISALWINKKGFTEQGGEAALSDAGRDEKFSWASVGLRGSSLVTVMPKVSVHANVAWQHALSDPESLADMTFTTGTSSFQVSGTPLDRNSIALGGGLGWQATSRVNVGMSYAGSISDRQDNHAVRINLTLGL